MIKVDTTITILAIPLMFLACQSQPASKAISQEQMVPAKEVQNAGCRSFDIKLSSASDPSKWNIGTQAEPLHPNLMTKFGRFSEISDYGNYQSLFMGTTVYLPMATHQCKVRNSKPRSIVSFNASRPHPVLFIALVHHCHPLCYL